MATKQLKAPKADQIEKTKIDWVKRPRTVNLRSNVTTRLIIPPEKTATMTRYEFMPGASEPVLADDVEILLDMKKEQKSCCGSRPGPTIKYFSEA